MNFELTTNLSKTSIFTWNNSIILSLLCIITMTFSDATSLFSYGYALILLAAISFFVCNKEVKDVFSTYHFYLLCAIIIYSILKYTYPEYMGLNGGAYTLDDNRFYAQLVNGNVSYFYTVYLYETMPYVSLLKFLYPFEIHTPLNIVAVNVIFTAYLPIYVRRLSILLTGDNEVGVYAFWYSFLCPFTLFFGCLILRELFTAVMVIAGLCYYLEKKYIPLSLCVISLIFVRFGTLAFLICGIIFLYGYQHKQEGRNYRFIALLIIAIVLFYFAYGFIQEFSGGKLGDSVIRSIDGSRYYEESTIGTIMTLPFPVNIMLSTIFFLFIPKFDFPGIDNGWIVIPSLFQGTLTPFFMFFLWKYIFNASYVAIKGKNKEIVGKIFYMVLLFALLLGTISLQSRHKTVLFPIICILAAYGRANYDKIYDYRSKVLASIIIVLQLLLAI